MGVWRELKGKEEDTMQIQKIENKEGKEHAERIRQKKIM